jgi:hypothetical protein
MMRRALVSIALVLTLSALGSPGAQAVGPICNVPSGTYPTIQSAVNDPTCTTIIVAPGNYMENVSINRPVTIDGGGSGPGGALSTVQSAAANTPVFRIVAAGTSPSTRVNLLDLRATGASGVGGNPSSGVLVQAPTTGFLTFEHFESVMNAGSGIALDFTGGSGVLDIQLSDCDLSDNGSTGFRVPTTVTLTELNISECHLDDNNLEGVAMFGSLLNSSFADTTFNRNGGSTTVTNAGQGISMHGFSGVPNVVDNLTISDSEANDNAGGHPTTNVSTGIQFASRAGDSFTNISILDSEMARNGRQGLRLERAGFGTISNITVTGNDIENNGESGISSFDAGAPPPSDVAINFNNITGNDVGIFNGSSGAFDAECNYWGHPTGPEAVDNPKGKGDAVIEAPGDVDYRPWSPRRIGRGENPEASCNRGDNP